MLDMTYEEYMGETFKIWFNNVLITEYFHVLEVTGRSLSPSEIKTITVPGKNGSRIQRKRKHSRVIQVKVFMIYESPEILRTKIDELNGVLNTNEAVSLVFSDEPNKTYYAMVSEISEDKEVKGNHIVTITFFRPEPFKYEGEYTDTFANGTVTFTNQGTAESPGTITVTMDVASSDVIISNGDKTLRIIYDLVIGDTLQIDFKLRKVFINGVLQMTAVDLNNPAFFTLKPGQNDLTITPATTASITYREAWL